MTAIDGSTAVVLIGLDETRRWQEDFYRHLHEHRAPVREHRHGEGSGR
jgi:hypothetical protein